MPSHDQLSLETLMRNWAIGRTTFTTSGQIIVGTGLNTFTALSVGADGEVLTADSSQPSGVKWATVSGGGGGGGGGSGAVHGDIMKWIDIGL